MNFNIRMGIPEMQELWLDLQEKYRSGNIKKKEEQLYKKWGKALKLLSADPGYPDGQHNLSLLPLSTPPTQAFCVGIPTSYYYNTLFYIICQSTFTYS